MTFPSFFLPSPRPDHSLVALSAILPIPPCLWHVGASWTELDNCKKLLFEVWRRCALPDISRYFPLEAAFSIWHCSLSLTFFFWLCPCLFFFHGPYCSLHGSHDPGRCTFFLGMHGTGVLNYVIWYVMLASSLLCVTEYIATLMLMAIHRKT